MASSLQQRFGQRCSPILHDACKPLASEKVAEAVCFKYGRCLCSDAGSQLFRFRNSILKLIKTVFKPKSLLRQDLASRRIVVCFEGTLEPILDPWARRDAQEDGLEVDGAKMEFWYAVSNMSFNPFEPSWMTMAKVADDEDAIPLAPGVIALHSNGSEFLDEFAGVERLPLHYCWVATWYRLYKSRQHVHRFIPGNQYVRRICEPIAFWPKPKGSAQNTGEAAIADHQD